MAEYIGEQEQSSQCSKEANRCIFCDKIFTKIAYLRRHIIIHTGEKPFKCPDCSKCFARRQGLRCHMPVHTGEKPFSCTDCSMCFPTKQQCKQHMYVHTREKPCKCTECDKSFVKYSDMGKHMYLHEHTSDRQLQSQAYDKQCTTTTVLGEPDGKLPITSCSRTEMSLYTKRRAKRYTCNICDKQVQNIKIHMRIHTGEEPEKTFKCPDCDLWFERKSGLDMHVVVHTGEKPYKCPLCDTWFGRKYDIKGHMLVHTGERRFQCEICDKRFKISGSLYRHMRIHTGEKLFECSNCYEQFARRDTLTKHMLSHNADTLVHKREELAHKSKKLVKQSAKRYKCQVCEKGLTTIRGLKRHSLLHSGEKPFSCPECGKQFSRSDVLSEHMKKHL